MDNYEMSPGFRGHVWGNADKGSYLRVGLAFTWDEFGRTTKTASNIGHDL